MGQDFGICNLTKKQAVKGNWRNKYLKSHDDTNNDIGDIFNI